jgi:hypothetical protein
MPLDKRLEELRKAGLNTTTTKEVQELKKEEKAVGEAIKKVKAAEKALDKVDAEDFVDAETAAEGLDNLEVFRDQLGVIGLKNTMSKKVNRRVSDIMKRCDDLINLVTTTILKDGKMAKATFNKCTALLGDINERYESLITECQKEHREMAAQLSDLTKLRQEDFEGIDKSTTKVQKALAELSKKTGVDTKPAQKAIEKIAESAKGGKPLPKQEQETVDTLLSFISENTPENEKKIEVVAKVLGDAVEDNVFTEYELEQFSDKLTEVAKSIPAKKDDSVDIGSAQKKIDDKFKVLNVDDKTQKAFKNMTVSVKKHKPLSKADAQTIKEFAKGCTNTKDGNEFKQTVDDSLEDGTVTAPELANIANDITALSKEDYTSVDGDDVASTKDETDELEKVKKFIRAFNDFKIASKDIYEDQFSGICAALRLAIKGYLENKKGIKGLSLFNRSKSYLKDIKSVLDKMEKDKNDTKLEKNKKDLKKKLDAAVKYHAKAIKYKPIRKNGNKPILANKQVITILENLSASID